MRGARLSHTKMLFFTLTIAIGSRVQMAGAQSHLINLYEVSKPMQIELTRFASLAPFIVADITQALKGGPAPGAINGVIAGAVKLPKVGIDLTVQAV